MLTISILPPRTPVSPRCRSRDTRPRRGDVLHVAALQQDLELPRVGPVEVLLADELDLVALGLVVEERPVDVGLALDVLRHLRPAGAPPFGCPSARCPRPAGRRTPARWSALDRELHPRAVRPLALDRHRRLEAAAERHVAEHPHRADRMQLVEAAAGRGELGDELVHRLCGRRSREQPRSREARRALRSMGLASSCRRAGSEADSTPRLASFEGARLVRAATRCTIATVARK